MIKHKKIYFNHFGFGEQDFIPCEVCGKRAVDIHHIDPKGMGGSKTKDHIDNLMALCRECHEMAHNGELSKNNLKYIREQRLLYFDLYCNKTTHFTAECFFVCSCYRTWEIQTLY